MKIYIAGPITGHLNYKEKFAVKEKELREMGHIVLNPSFLPDGLKDYMPICYAMMDQADLAYFLKGWEDSVGANLENEYCIENGIRTVFENEISIVYAK